MYGSDRRSIEHLFDWYYILGKMGRTEWGTNDADTSSKGLWWEMHAIGLGLGTGETPTK
jgi:hypothetical protein